MTATEQIMALLERWDRQQEGYIRQREERYEAMFQLLEDLFGRDGRFTAIDAACGPGSPAGACSNASRRRGWWRWTPTSCCWRSRVRRWPVSPSGSAWWSATSPIQAGPNGSPKRASPRRRTARGAALSTALHWLSPAELAGFYAQAGELLAPAACC